MTAPSTTVFEVQVSNKLSNEHIFVKLEAELHDQYTTNITSSPKNWDAKKTYQSTADSNNMEERKCNNNKSHIKSDDTSQHNTSTKTSSMNVNVNHNKASHETSSYQSHQMRDNLQHNMNSSLPKQSKRNKIIEPGYVRVAPLQSISIPVIIAYESQVVYISVYIENGN
eukprot:79110_1